MKVFTSLLEHPRLKPTREFLLKHKRHIPAAALLLGFFWDLLTLGRPDRLFDNLVVLAYLTIAGGTILLLNLRQKRSEEAKNLPLIALMQFSFGNLASALLVLYGHSGTFEGSFLFFLILGGFLIGNEFLRDRYTLIRAHVGAFFLLLLAYLALVIPILLGDISTRAFLLSGLAALSIIGIFTTALFTMSRHLVVKNFTAIILVVAGVYGSFNFLYFTNILPPVPLALRHIGIYHSIERQADGSYFVSFERPGFFEFFNDTSNSFHAAPNTRAFCFSSVFAPAGLTAPVHHRWEYKNTAGDWETRATIPFPISGGRDLGYRGYSIKTLDAAGEWRCNVETIRGALIGRETFTAVLASTTVPLTMRLF